MNQSQRKAVKITKEIFQVAGSQLSTSEDAAIYLINFDGHAALVDAGFIGKKGNIWLGGKTGCAP